MARVNDRGPFVDGRIIDLSREAADELDMRRDGVARVRVRYLGQAPRLGGGTVLRAEAPRTGEPHTVQMANVQPAPIQTTPQPYYTPQPPYTPPPAYAPPQAVPTPVAPIGGSYWVQAGAFRDPGAAQRIAERLGARAKVDETGGGYRVLVGPWIDQAAAESARQAVMARGYADALLISGG